MFRLTVPSLYIANDAARSGAIATYDDGMQHTPTQRDTKPADAHDTRARARTPKHAHANRTLARTPPREVRARAHAHALAQTDRPCARQVESRDSADSTTSTFRVSTLNLVDLAGR